MKHAALAALLRLALPASAQERLKCGTVESLEVTSLTRTKVTAFLRSDELPDARRTARRFSSKGRSSSRTRCCRWGRRSTALVQHAEGRHEAVFLVDLELSKVPAELLGASIPPRSDFTFEGNLSSPASSATDARLRRRRPAGRHRRHPRVGPASARTSRASPARASPGSRSPRRRARRRSSSTTRFSFPLDVKDLVYEIRAGDRAVASGERHGVRLHPARENAIVLPVAASNARPHGGARGRHGVRAARVEGRLVATISVKVGKDQAMTVPLNLPGTIQVGR